MPAERAEQIARAFDLRALPADFLANPYPVYAELRRRAPVLQLPDGSFFLTRHADLMSVYRDAQLFSADKTVEFTPKYGAGTPLLEHHTTSLVFNDPPLHTRVRRIIMGALTRRAIAEMEPGLVALVDRLLDALAARGGGDLIEDFASAIPVEIIGNLLAVPVADRGPLRAWSLAILGALEPQLTPAQRDAGNQAVTEFKAYLVDLVRERRARPGDPAHDVLTRLIQGERLPDGQIEHLSELELLHNCIFLLNAGHETTTNLIGNGLLALVEHPHARSELLQLLKQHGEDSRSLIDGFDLAVDEILRFESSNQLGNRRALRACEVGGTALPEGALITLGIGAANRDPDRFERPDSLWLTRPDNRHLAFGFGPHQCAGLSLARLEGRVALSHFLARFPHFRLTAAPQRGMRARFRGFARAPFTTG